MGLDTTHGSPAKQLPTMNPKYPKDRLSIHLPIAANPGNLGNLLRDLEWLLGQI